MICISLVMTSFVLFLLWQSWTTLVSTSVVLFWSSVLGAVLVGFPIYSQNFGDFSLLITFALGYFFNWCDFGMWWILIFGAACLVGPRFNFRKGSRSYDNTTKEGRAWLNSLLSTLLAQISGLEIADFDIGDTLPDIEPLYLAPEELRPRGFDMVVAVNYETNDSTNLSIRLPLNIPAYGEIKVPVSVAAPQFSGKIRMDCRLEECSFRHMKDGQQCNSTENFMALGVAFDNIDTISFGDIQLMTTMNWLQSIGAIKQQIHALINDALSTDAITIHLFDKDFVYIGCCYKPRSRSMEDESNGYRKISSNGAEICDDDNWTLHEIVSELNICSNCGTKYFPEFPPGCCQDTRPRSRTLLNRVPSKRTTLGGTERSDPRIAPRNADTLSRGGNIPDVPSRGLPSQAELPQRENKPIDPKLMELLRNKRNSPSHSSDPRRHSSDGNRQSPNARDNPPKPVITNRDDPRLTLPSPSRGGNIPDVPSRGLPSRAVLPQRENKPIDPKLMEQIR
eukprot:TRINITY_DN327_c0_g1_i3.p1 TRINITY_DN327_c0_g1~~TRINITY_DN327_c0_g1_i3.p1  ORF type:complete len:508 (-),score=105.18 TRINITY_DN327_c0_g1_i3:206-1729(-)